MKKRLENFQLDWRFTDPNYNVLPDDVLVRIEPLSEEAAIKVWKKYVSDSYNHILKIPKSTMATPKKTFNVVWEEDQLSKEKIISCLKELKEDESLYFLWSPECAVKTYWGVFANFWSDFCYPDDDNDVIIVDNKIKIIFCEERFYIYDITHEKNSHRK